MDIPIGSLPTETMTAEPENISVDRANRSTQKIKPLTSKTPSFVDPISQIDENIETEEQTIWDHDNVAELLDAMGQDEVNWLLDDHGISEGDWGKVGFQKGDSNVLYLEFENEELAKGAFNSLSAALTNPYEFSSRFDISPTEIKVTFTDNEIIKECTTGDIAVGPATVLQKRKLAERSLLRDPAEEYGEREWAYEKEATRLQKLHPDWTKEQIEAEMDREETEAKEMFNEPEERHIDPRKMDFIYDPFKGSKF